MQPYCVNFGRGGPQARIPTGLPIDGSAVLFAMAVGSLMDGGIPVVVEPIAKAQ